MDGVDSVPVQHRASVVQCSTYSYTQLYVHTNRPFASPRPPTTARNQNCVEDPDNCVSEKLFKDIADRMVADGWRDAGYTYV